MKKNIIERLKEVFTENKKEDVNLEDTEVVETFVDIKTVDGRILRADDIAVDQSIVEITENGEEALEDGTYELSDGTSIVVVDGIITEIIEDSDAEAPAKKTDSDAEAPAGKNNKTAEKTAEKTTEPDEISEELTAEEAELFSSIKSMVVDFNSVKEEVEKLKAENIALTKRVNKFADEPSDESTNTTVEFKNTTKEDKLKFFGKK